MTPLLVLSVAQRSFPDSALLIHGPPEASGAWVAAGGGRLWAAGGAGGVGGFGGAGGDCFSQATRASAAVRNTAAVRASRMRSNVTLGGRKGWGARPVQRAPGSFLASESSIV